MTMEGMYLIPLELNLHKYDLVIISQIINMIKTDGFWHHKMFESVLSDLQNMWMEGIRKLENASKYCTNNAENDAKMDGVACVVLVRIKMRHMGREKKAQSKKVRTKQNPTHRIEWKTN